MFFRNFFKANLVFYFIVKKVITTNLPTSTSIATQITTPFLTSQRLTTLTSFLSSTTSTISSLSLSISSDLAFYFLSSTTSSIITPTLTTSVLLSSNSLNCKSENKLKLNSLFF